jgi:hypothetical protein
MAVPSLKIFRYIDDLDCFVVSDQYREIADVLGLAEWNPVVWIGRLFTMDNDFGEHWFDNWELRELSEAEAEKLGVPSEELMIIDPDRFKDGADGPCHPPEVRKRFWTNVLQSLELSYDLLFDEARLMNAKCQEWLPDMYIADLEERIARIRREIDQGTNSAKAG